MHITMGRIIWTIVFAIIAGAIQYMVRQMLAAWGILDPFAIQLGTWLDTHITASQIGWAIATALAIAIYIVALWFVWSKSRLAAKTAPDVGDIQNHVASSPVSDPAEESDTELSTALLLISELSSWMRWQDAQRIGDGQAALTDDSKINLAENVLRQRLAEGRLSARGRRRGALEYEKIPPDLWKLVYLDIQRDRRTFWRVTMKARDGLEQEAVERVPDYVSLQVSEQRIKELWPAKDNQLDREIALLLERAQTKDSD